MTYCVALVLNDGLVFASDSRTNAGIDYVTTFSKLHVFNPAPDRFFVLLSAGNLATTQGVLNRITRDLEHPSDRLSKWRFTAAMPCKSVTILSWKPTILIFAIAKTVECRALRHFTQSAFVWLGNAALASGQLGLRERVMRIF